MLPFSVDFKPGVPVHRQVVYVVKRAIVSGQLLPGDAFPSVRVLSQGLKINPNTAHKIVMTLTNEGLLEVRPGIGTVVAQAPRPTRAQRSALLNDEVERLVVEARKMSLEVEDVIEAVQRHWNQMIPRERKGK